MYSKLFTPRFRIFTHTRARREPEIKFNRIIRAPDVVPSLTNTNREYYAELVQVARRPKRFNVPVVRSNSADGKLIAKFATFGRKIMSLVISVYSVVFVVDW